MLAELIICRLEHRREWKEFDAAMISPFMMSRHDFRKAPVNLSGPGALSDGIWLIAFFNSSSVKGVCLNLSNHAV